MFSLVPISSISNPDINLNISKFKSLISLLYTVTQFDLFDVEDVMYVPKWSGTIMLYSSSLNFTAPNSPLLIIPEYW